MRPRQKMPRKGGMPVREVPRRGEFAGCSCSRCELYRRRRDRSMAFHHTWAGEACAYRVTMSNNRLERMSLLRLRALAQSDARPERSQGAARLFPTMWIERQGIPVKLGLAFGSGNGRRDREPSPLPRPAPPDAHAPLPSYHHRSALHRLRRSCPGSRRAGRPCPPDRGRE